MKTFTLEQFRNLSQIDGQICVSIFVPTHKVGVDVITGKDELVFKNQLKEVKTKLITNGMSEKEVNQFLAPTLNLLGDEEFWNHQIEGLAIFMKQDYFEIFKLPIHFAPLNYVSKSFYLLPLTELFVGDGRFFVLALEVDAVKLFECSKTSIEEIKTDHLIPQQLEDAVGYDYHQKNVQFRSKHDGHGGASFHGHGEGKDNEKLEIEKYFREIDKGLMEILRKEDAPLVLASLSSLFGIYKEVNKYKYLHTDFISVNPKDKEDSWLHQNAWQKVSPLFETKKNDKVNLFKQLSASNRTSFIVEEILPAAVNGRIDTLFIKRNSDVWGFYDADTQNFEIQYLHQLPNISLTNLAAMKVFLQGGNVYIFDEEVMPNPETNFNALFRF